MRCVNVKLSSVDAVQAFVEAVSPLPGDFELISGGYILDAKSLMGIFSLDLSRPVILKVYEDSPEAVAALRPFTDGDFPAKAGAPGTDNQDGDMA